MNLIINQISILGDLMLTSKQRSYLRGVANTEAAIIQIGKGGVDQTVIQSTREALTARELIKCRVLQNALVTAGESSELLADALKADVVCVTGSTFVLFKRNPQNPKIEIPTKKNPKPSKK